MTRERGPREFVKQQIEEARRAARDFFHLAPGAKLKCASDLLRLRGPDPGVDRAIDECIGWLCRAQEHSRSQDGGVAHSFSLLSGWSTSYPETTGYVVPTLIDHAKLRDNDDARERARRMLDWLVSIQMPDGSFQGGRIDSEPRVPVTFNTGQILLGLVAGTKEFGAAYRESMRRAADWLVLTQDPDGAWRRHSSPFAMPGDRTYDTHVAWALLEAARIEPQRCYADAALANVRWAIRHQRDNGWFDHCCLTDPARPLTHTLGYTFRGVVEAHRFSGDPTLLSACRRTADGLLSAMNSDGSLPGRLYRDWRAAASWSCLTGNVQIAACWLLLYEHTNEAKYRDAALAANKYVRSTMSVAGGMGIRGAVAGSFPIYGDYGRYSYLNWAAKFCVDSNMLEKRLPEARAIGPGL